jgi:hypothetical protein
MRLTLNVVAAVATAAAFVSAATLPASAECKKYGFTVNDYGKDGPTRDSKSLLDKLIATKMSEKGVKDFHTGKKDVSCELFLNFIVFDEHTCTASATVCWGGSSLPKGEQTSASTEDAKEAKPAKKAADAEEHQAPKKKKELAKKSEAAVEQKKTATLRIADPKKPAHHVAKAVTEAAEAPAAAAAAASETPAPGATTAQSEPGAAKPVETGSLSEPAAKLKTHHTEKSASQAPASAKSGGDSGYPTPMPPQSPPEN